jgi:glycosyltransferase involved in cell wall biosynthesis
MKVVISMPWYTPAFKAGGPIQSVEQLITSCEDRHRFMVICSNKDVDGTNLRVSTINQWQEFSRHCSIAYLTGLNSVFTYHKLVKQKSPDIIYIIGIYGWLFMIYPLFFIKASRKIISVRGMLHPGALSQKPWKKAIYLFLLKNLIQKKKVSFHATDSYEAELIKFHFGEKFTINIATNIPRSVVNVHYKNKIKNELSLLSVCLISTMKNIREVLIALSERREKIIYTIVGPAKDKDYLKICQSISQSLPSNIQVNFEGEISPNKISDYFSQTDVFILPSKSENFGHAIIESLNYGIPVITSHGTPWNELLSQRCGINIHPIKEQFNEAFELFLSMDETVIKDWRDGAKKYAKSHIDRDLCIRQHNDMFSIEK